MLMRQCQHRVGSGPLLYGTALPRLAIAPFSRAQIVSRQFRCQISTAPTCACTSPFFCDFGINR